MITYKTTDDEENDFDIDDFEDDEEGDGDE
jgi:hypothetical protein